MAQKDKKEDIQLRPHSYDGIHEYDQRLPNWWLYTLYGAIFFAFIYWFLQFQPGGMMMLSSQRVEAEMQAVNAIRFASLAENINDDLLWEMSHNPIVVEAGKKTYYSICVTCHGENLEGGIGFNLSDDNWVHSNQATGVLNTVTNGVAGKGMQAWGPTLGAKKVAEVVAFVLSHHDRATMENSPLVPHPDTLAQ